MASSLEEGTLRYVILRLLENADRLKSTRQTEDSEFNDGLSCAYYEILDMLKSEIDANGGDLSAYGLDVDLEAEYA